MCYRGVGIWGNTALSGIMETKEDQTKNMVVLQKSCDVEVAPPHSKNIVRQTS